jgi:hypothetical protein
VLRQGFPTLGKLRRGVNQTFPTLGQHFQVICKRNIKKKIMKKVFIAVTFSLISFCVFGQTTVIYNAQGKVIGGSHIKTTPGKIIKLVDSLTKNYFILDANHVYITAFDKTGKKLWKTDPYKDSNMGEYRTNRPIVVNFTFESDNWCSGKTKVIAITYDNTEFGYLDIKTGKYFSCGRD